MELFRIDTTYYQMDPVDTKIGKPLGKDDVCRFHEKEK